MTSINFPSSPTIGESFSVGGRTWVWDGAVWNYIGMAGPSGPSGPVGATGPSGVAGANGPTGSTGPQGATGVSGTSGSNGATGATGPAGTSGSNGATGPTGPAGSSGSAGSTGATGATGPAGSSGSAGSTGATGATGPAGLFSNQITTPPTLSSWTQLNISSSATAADSGVGPVITDAFGTGPRVRALLQNVPSAPYTIDALFSVAIPASNYSGAGICFSDGTKVQAMAVGMNNGSVNRVVAFTSPSIFSADSTASQFWFFSASSVWMRVKDDGTNIYFYHSGDGVNWNLRYSVAKASGFLGASGYTKVGFMLDVEGTAQAGSTQACSITLLSWKQT